MTINPTRHSGIFNANTAYITMIGVGGIGSFAAIVFGKMGVGDLYLKDKDVIEDVNIATQLLPFNEIDEEKAKIVAGMVEYFGGQAKFEASNVTSDTDPGEITNQIIVSGVDSIKARKTIWEIVKKTESQWYLDARMAAEEFHIFCVDMEDPEWYDKALSENDDDSIPDLPCTEKATIYTGAMAAGHLGSYIRMIVTGITPPHFMVHNILNQTIVKS